MVIAVGGLLLTGFILGFFYAVELHHVDPPSKMNCPCLPDAYP